MIHVVYNVQTHCFKGLSQASVIYNCLVLQVRPNQPQCRSLSVAPVSDTESDPCWDWSGLTYKTDSVAMNICTIQDVYTHALILLTHDISYHLSTAGVFL